MSNAWERFLSMVEESKEDAAKTYAGNKAAGGRLRKRTMQLRNCLKEIRQETLSMR